MKKKSAPQSAFLNLRISIGLLLVLAGILLGSFGWTGFSAQAGQGKEKDENLMSPLVPPGFDCARIRELGIHTQENFRAGAIMIFCHEADGGKPDYINGSELVQSILQPAAFGSADVDLVTGADSPTHITQSETYTAANPDNPNQVLVAYNDSRGATTNYSGLSVSTDGGTTFTRITTVSGQSPFTSTLGDPVVLYNKPSATWFTVWLDTACGGQGLGGYKSTNPSDPTSWVHYCIHTNSNDDRESGWADNNPSSPFYGRMYVSFADYNVGSGALVVRYSTDNGLTWPNTQQLTTGTPFIRNVQITGDYLNGDLYIAGMNEGGGGFPHNDNNLIYRSTNGGAAWTNTYTGPAFAGPGVTAVGYFACMFSDGGGFWRHEGWGEPAVYNHVVSLVYAQQGASGDAGDVYYIRSTDSGTTFSAPFKLNTDATTRPQWQPNLSASSAGTLLATWYDARESATCTKGNPAVPCYRMYSRKSNDNGVSWLPDDALSDVVSPLPGQPDGNVQATYAGDYDYGSALLTKHVTSWTDGRVAISSASQQDTFTDRELVGFGVTSTNPACASTVSTQPTDFVVNVTDPVNAATLAGSDFTVNGTPANSVIYTAGQTTMTFHFNSTPVITQGAQTMAIAAGAFNRASDNQPNLAFSCTFNYDAVLLQVTTTVPAVSGTFTPDAPNNYQYDVNFNEAVNPASVSTGDLTVSGNSGPSVTGVVVLAGNTTARFTLHMNFGGTMTASIAAGAITDAFGNPNLAFSGSYTVSGCPPQDHYNITQIGGSIVPGTTDIGNHTDDGVTTIALPFSYTLYDQAFPNITVSSNGTAQFTTTDNNWTNSCLPWITPTSHNYSILPYWDDQCTGPCTGVTGTTYGIFTSTSGGAPNRIFNIEWRSAYYNSGGTGTPLNYELRLYEGQSRFDVIYGSIPNGTTSATSGVQKSDTIFDQYFCNGTGGASSGGQSYILLPCGTPSPTPTPTATFTGTPSPTPTATSTSTATATATATATIASTPTPSPITTVTPTPGCQNYGFTNSSGSIVTATTDIGNHTDDGETFINLPFPVSLYGNTYSFARAGSNGYLSFGSFVNNFYTGCLPNTGFSYTIFPFETDQITTPAGMGIFTLTTGTAPNRTFYIEWRTCHYSTATTCLSSTNSNYEVVFQEGVSDYSIVYGTFDSANTAYGAIGVQGFPSTTVTQSQCAVGRPASSKQIWSIVCGTPTPTPSGTISPTPTATPTATSTATATPTVAPSVTPTPPCPNATPILTENFDSVTVPALPTGWVASNSGTNDPALWVTSNSGAPTPVAFSPPNSASINDPATVNDKRLESPTIAINGPAQVSFRNYYNLETSVTPGLGFDGGVLEISINGGVYADITVGGVFLAGGYNATISTQFSSPLSARQAWSGDSGGFINTVVNLPAAANGQPIKLRWRMGSDSSVSDEGWRIDNVSILDCLPSGSPSPTATATATATATVPPTVSVSGTVTYCTNPAIPPIPGVTLGYTGTTSGSGITNGSGGYTLSGLTSGGSYTMTPTKAALPTGSAGFNTTDVIAVQRHFLVIGTPLSGCKLTAADCASPPGITTGDVIAIQRFFLSFTSGIGNVGKYQFTPSSRVYSPLNSDQAGQNYDTIVFGDVATNYVH